MATKSILKNVVVKDSGSVKKLVNVLENAQKKVIKPHKKTRPASNATADDIKKMFGEG